MSCCALFHFLLAVQFHVLSFNVSCFVVHCFMSCALFHLFLVVSCFISHWLGVVSRPCALFHVLVWCFISCALFHVLSCVLFHLLVVHCLTSQAQIISSSHTLTHSRRSFASQLTLFNLLLPLQEMDLVALVSGGVCLGYSDAHYGHPRNLISPWPPASMADGWETARRLDRPSVLKGKEGHGGRVFRGPQTRKPLA